MDQNGDAQMDNELIAKLVFRVADKFFKLLSWLAALVALRYGWERSHDRVILVVLTLAKLLFVAALFTQCLYLNSRDPVTLGIPVRWHRVSHFVQRTMAVILGVALTLPTLYLDELIDALLKAK